MPVNHYLDFFNNIAEQRLYEDLIHETVQFYGIDAIYLVRDSESSLDLLFGEDPTSKFTTPYPVEVYVQSVDNFEGGELFSKFGLEVKKQARFLIPNRSFQRSVAQYSPNNFNGAQNPLIRPREGDLIWMKNFNALFEIKYADEEHFFYTFGNSKIYGYSLVCEKFRYSNERINTSIPEIDNTMDTIIPSFSYTMKANGSGNYVSGELVSQPNANGVVVSWDLPSLTLTLKHINGLFVVNTAVTGANSNTSFILANTSIIDDVNRHLENNLDIEDEGKSILTFTETNPWGEPNMNE